VGTVPAQVCIAIRKAGIANVNPSDPRLIALVSAGASIDEFVSVVPLAAGKSDGFSYVLGIVKNRRREAENIANNPGQAPPKSKAQSNADMLAALTGGLTSRKVPNERIIDAESTRID
jgi:hypothetical protein